MAEDDAKSKAKAVRKRPIMQAVWFTPEEWRQVQERMLVTRPRNFGVFARAALLNQTLMVRQSLDVSALRPELARIGNNVNQIARQANLDKAVSVADVQAVRGMLAELQASLDELAGRR